MQHNLHNLLLSIVLAPFSFYGLMTVRRPIDQLPFSEILIVKLFFFFALIFFLYEIITTFFIKNFKLRRIIKIFLFFTILFLGIIQIELTVINSCFWCIIFFSLHDAIMNFSIQNYKIKAITKLCLFLTLVFLGIIQFMSLIMTMNKFQIWYITLLTEKDLLKHLGIEYSIIYNLLIYGSVTFFIFGLIGYFLIFRLQKNNINCRIGKLRTTMTLLIIFTFVTIEKKIIIVHEDIANTINEKVIYKPQPLKKFFYTDKEESFYKRKMEISLKKLFSEIDNLKIKNKTKELPNILFIMLESVRYDEINKGLLTQISNQVGITANNHYATSNFTPYAVFSILTGLFPSYYHQCLNAEFCQSISHKLFKLVGYKNHILASAPLNFMNQHKYLGINEYHNITDNTLVDSIKYFDMPVVLGDQEEVYELDKILSDSRHPNFITMFLNSTHHNYNYPKIYEKHLPVLAEDGIINTYIQEYQIKERLYNRYKNSVMYINSLLKQIFAITKRTKRKSIIIIYGDHGEEFGETGLFFHAGDLNKHQLNSLMFMQFPNMQNKIDKKQATSHLDVLPTVLDYIEQHHGINIKINMMGHSLLSDVQDDERLVLSAKFIFSRIIEVTYGKKNKLFKLTRDNNKKAADLLNSYQNLERHQVK